MKQIIILFICFSSIIFPQQKYYTFSELNGMEDNEGNTHLFYRMYHFSGDYQTIFNYENSIYHLVTGNETDSLFLPDYAYANQIMSYSIYTHGYDLWDKDPAKYILCFTDNSLVKTADVKSPTTSIKRFDQDIPGYSNISGYAKVKISKQNDSLLYALNGISLKSTDGGWNWGELPLEDLFFSDLNPYNDKFIFLHDYSGKLYKSSDGGETTTLVDTTTDNSIGTNWNPSHFEYDSDTMHIYRLYEKRLFISDNQGEAFTWQKKYSSENQLFISIDSSQSGHIYFADGRFILYSADYGETFNLFKEFGKKLVGIYKKPNSEILYAATKYDLYEIRPDTTVILKHLEIDPDILSWYPLKIGNKWVYETTIELTKTDHSIEVVGDTVIDEKHYFKIKYYTPNNTSYFYERIDSIQGKVFRNEYGKDIQYYDFTLTDAGDTILFDVNETDRVGWILESIGEFNRWDIISQKHTYNVLLSVSGFFLNTFVKRIGLYSYEGGEILLSSTVLKGFIKDGEEYGNTVVGINEVEENLPKEFSLFQNYPNPFNPTTKIKFTIPTSPQTPLLGKERGRGEVVTLKIYDILGNEVATLVNEEKSPGEYEVEFDASKYSLSSGVYFYQLKADSFVQIKKLILMK